MTRINVVPVEELSDQHLIAEYHELPRVIKQNIDISDAPDKYCLGKGHMKWARKSMLFTLSRYRAIYYEMIKRGFHPKHTPHDLTLYAFSQSDFLYTKYEPTQEALKLNRDRLIEKYKQKPDWYKWTNREKPSYYD